MLWVTVYKQKHRFKQMHAITQVTNKDYKHAAGPHVHMSFIISHFITEGSNLTIAHMVNLFLEKLKHALARCHSQHTVRDIELTGMKLGLHSKSLFWHHMINIWINEQFKAIKMKNKCCCISRGPRIDNTCMTQHTAYWCKYVPETYQLLSYQQLEVDVHNQPQCFHASC